MVWIRVSVRLRLRCRRPIGWDGVKLSGFTGMRVWKWVRVRVTRVKCRIVLNGKCRTLTLLVGRQEGHLACKKHGGWWRWALVSPELQMEWCSTGWSLCLPLLIFPCTIKSRSSLLAPAHPGGPG